MAYSQEQARDDHGRWTSGGQGSSQARAEKVALNRKIDQRKFSPRNNRPFGPVAQLKKNGGDGGGGSGGSGGMMDKIMQGLKKRFGTNTPSEERVREIMAQTTMTGAHTQAIHQATAGKTLAQVSAMGSVGTFKGGNNG